MRRLLGIAATVVLVALSAPSSARADPYYVYESIVLRGDGSGRVWTFDANGLPDGLIDCRIVNGFVDPREVCDQQFDAGDDHEIQIHLWISAGAGSCLVITSQSTCAEGYENGLSISLTGDDITEFTFNRVAYGVTVTRTGTGTGEVRSAQSGIVCGVFCTGSWYYGDAVNLTATPDAGSYFAGWTGACDGQDATCDLVIGGHLAFNAVFMLGNGPTPAVSAGATPGGTSGPTPRSTPRSTASGPPAFPTAAPTTGAIATAGPSASPGPQTPGASSVSSSPAASAPVAVEPASTASSNPIPLSLWIVGVAAMLGLLFLWRFRLRR